MRLKNCTSEPERKKSLVLSKQSTPNTQNYEMPVSIKAKYLVFSKEHFVLAFIGQMHALFRDSHHFY